MFNSIAVQTSTVDSYHIHFGNNILGEVKKFVLDGFSSEKVFLIIDQQVHKLHISKIEAEFQNSFGKVLKYVVPSGEQSKSFGQYSSIIDFVLKEGVERGTPLIAIGGGVVGDLAGFVAATVLRGIPLIHVPTTLLAMVDSSIGGKTGINHSTGKNLVGSFYQPKSVFVDVSFLKTLPEEEWVNGLSEIIKYGMIERPELLEEVQQIIENSRFSKPKEWLSIIEQSAGIKVDIVQRDVREGGIRAFLNFGHTYAHVIERIGNYEKFSHGEAVFAGMYGAIKASNLLGAEIETSYLDAFKSLYSIDLASVKSSFDKLISLMLRDKKTQRSTIHLVLLEALGKPYVTSVNELSIVEESWKFLLDQFQ